MTLRQRQPREKNAKHLDYIRSLPCCICGGIDTEAAHIRTACLALGNGCPRPKAIGETVEKAAENWNTRQAASQGREGGERSEVQTGGVSALVKAAEDVCAYDYADNTCTELQHDIETLRAAIASVSDAAQASTIPDCYRDEMLRGLIAFFSESVHAVWDSGEIADCLTGMMSEASSVPSAHREGES